MATSRRKTSGFTAPKEEETVLVEEFLDESAKEVFESIAITEEKEEVEEVKEEEAPAPAPVAPPAPAPKPAAVLLPDIIPTEAPGPRFVEPTPEPVAKPVAAPKLNPPPKRHPRNVPRFSARK